MGLKITVTPVTKYDIRIGGKSIGYFDIDSRHDGLVGFKDDKKRKVIAKDSVPLIRRVLGGERGEYEVVELSPGLVNGVAMAKQGE